MAYDIGVQSYTFRESSIDDIITELAETPVTAIELCDAHIDPDASSERVEAVRERFADAGIDVCGYGVHSFGSDLEEVHRTIDFAERLGVSYVSLDVEPDADDVIDTLIEAATDAGIDLGIHNHGPASWATYGSVEEVLTVLDGRPTILGACVDTGHYLRVGESPEEVIPKLGERVHGIHITDYSDGTEYPPGEGDLDLGTLVSLLEEHTRLDAPLVIEYEADPSDPAPGVVATAERLQAVLE